MDDEDDDVDDIECLGDCQFEVRRETRTQPDGRVIAEEVERCLCCGRVLSRQPIFPS